MHLFTVSMTFLWNHGKWKWTYSHLYLNKGVKWFLLNRQKNLSMQMQLFASSISTNITLINLISQEQTTKIFNKIYKPFFIFFSMIIKSYWEYFNLGCNLLHNKIVSYVKTLNNLPERVPGVVSFNSTYQMRDINTRFSSACC